MAVAGCDSTHLHTRVTEIQVLQFVLEDYVINDKTLEHDYIYSETQGNTPKHLQSLLVLKE